MTPGCAGAEQLHATDAVTLSTITPVCSLLKVRDSANDQPPSGLGKKEASRHTHPALTQLVSIPELGLWTILGESCGQGYPGEVQAGRVPSASDRRAHLALGHGGRSGCAPDDVSRLLRRPRIHKGPLVYLTNAAVHLSRQPKRPPQSCTCTLLSVCNEHVYCRRFLFFAGHN